MIDPLTKARKQGSDAMKEPALSSSAGGAGGQPLQQPTYRLLEIKNNEKNGDCHLCASAACVSQSTTHTFSTLLLASKKNKGPERLRDLLEATELTSSGAKIQTREFLRSPELFPPSTMQKCFPKDSQSLVTSSICSQHPCVVK